MKKPIPGYEGRYSIDSSGNVYSNYGQGRKLKPRWWRNRFTVMLYSHGKGKPKTIHSLVLETFVGPRPKGMFACHGKNGREDNSLDNAYWATPSQNAYEDRLRDGTDCRGEKNPRSKLNRMQVRIIRKLCGIVSQNDTAQLFNISQGVVCNIQKRRIWGWLI